MQAHLVEHRSGLVYLALAALLCNAASVSAQNLAIVNATVTPNPAVVGEKVTIMAQVVTVDEQGKQSSAPSSLNVEVDFGDGQLAKTLDAVHTYTASGSYIVRITALSGSASTSYSTSLEVNEPKKSTLQSINEDDLKVASHVKVTIKEDYKVAVKGFKEDGALYYEEVPAGTTIITAELSLEGLKVADIDEKTTYSYSFGENFMTEGKLGDDPFYKKGAKRARILTREDIGWAREKIIVVEAVTITWDEKKNLVTARITAKTPDFVDTVLAEEMVDNGEVGKFQLPVLCELRFGNIIGLLMVRCNVSISGKTLVKGKGDNAETFNTYIVKSSGGAIMTQLK